jgi:hypothetical protein
MILDPAVAIAKIFGPFMLILGIWMLMFSTNLNKIWNALKTDPCCFFLMGLLNLLFGIYIVSQYNSWGFDKSFLVTLLGWVLTIRGILAIFVPQFLMKKTMAGPSQAKVMGLIPLIWGIALCWFAFS